MPGNQFVRRGFRGRSIEHLDAHEVRCVRHFHAPAHPFDAAEIEIDFRGILPGHDVDGLGQ
jgi:hypothetical protein